MDYNDNDYEGQSLHLAGEESSKISVLPPFALPKFDFDDNLHGHLRFDSLVENEVFLGIPSQEDNHWIEDFSRGGNGIEFSSSAAESCALPRHINVWSEATSSESVEMLLKAVGQEDMVPGENIIEESHPGDQPDSSTRQMDDILREDYNVDDSQNPSLPPAEVEGSLSKLNQSTGVEDDQTENDLQVESTSYGASIDNIDGSLTVTSGNSNLSVKRANDKQGETCGLADETLTNQTLENLLIIGKETNNTQSASQNIDVSVREYVEQDKISDISFVRSSHMERVISDPVEEQKEGCSENDARLSGIVVETENKQKRCSHEIPSGLQSPKEEHAVENRVTNFGEASNFPGMGDYISTDDGHNNVVFVLEPADCSQHSTVAGSETQQLIEGHSTSHEKSSVTLQGEGIEGLGIRGSDVTPILHDTNEMKQVPVVKSPDQHEKSSVALQGEGTEGSDDVTPILYANNEKKQDPVIQSPDPHKILVGNEDISPKSKCSFEGPSTSSEFCMLPEVLGNTPKKDDDHNFNHAADGPGHSTGSTVSGKCCGEKSVTDDMKDAKYTAAIQKDNVEDGDHIPSPLEAGSIQANTEDIVSMQVDAPVSNLVVSAHEKEGDKLPLDSHKIYCDDIDKEVESATVEKTTGLQPHSSVGNYPVLNINVRDMKLASSCVELDELAESHVNNLPSSDSGHKDQSKETDFEAPIPLSPSAPKESLKSNELAPAIETKKGIKSGSAAGEIKTSHQSGSLLETSSVTKPNETPNELNKKMEHSASVLTAQDDGVEDAPTKKAMEVESERNQGTSSSALSVLIDNYGGSAVGGILAVTSCAVKTDKSNKVAVPGASCADLTQNEVNKQMPLNRNNGEHFGKILRTSEISGVSDPPKEDGTFTFDIRPLGGQSTEDSGKDTQSLPKLQACKLSLTGEVFPSISSSSQTDLMMVKETSHVSSATPGVCRPSGGLAGSSEHKSRRGGGSKSGKGSSKKANLVKETSHLKQAEKGDNSSPFLSPLGTGQLMTFESSGKPRGAVSISIPISCLPDLNTSASSSAFFQQPFTDLQQVQLRAQIFVYGSLIQGAAPDEACMLSAFDGGSNVWERSWRACVDRLHGQKSQGNNIGTPFPSHSGVKVPDQTNRQSFHQSEVLSSSAGRASNKAIPSPVVNPSIPRSSPLWSISTPSGEALPPSCMSRGAVIDYQAVSALNPYQTTPMLNYIAHTTWPPQASPASFPVPWLSSSQSSPFEISTSYPPFPISESVKSTAIKESSLTITSGTKHLSPIPATHTGPATMLPRASSLDPKKVKVSGQTGDTKTRKRKKSSGVEDVAQVYVTALSETVSVHAVANQLSNKASAVEDLSQISLIAQNQAGSMSTPVVGSHYSTSVAVTIPSSSSFLPKSTTNQAFPVVLPSISSGSVNKGNLSTDKRTLNIESYSKIEEAKLQAQEAAAHAVAAISHCEGVWSLLDQQKSSGLTSDAESKLAAAAVAIAAAASVANAAAAAAKIASNVAAQAKQMADEAVTTSGTLSAIPYDSNLVYNSMNLPNASPAYILKGGDRSNAPSLAISAAREASRKRIEAASAATRHAENLDAIVKAAELAAEAVTHTGKVVAMGDPFLLSALAEAGPNNYWKVLQMACLPGSKSNNMNKNISSNAGEAPDVHNQLEGPDKDMRLTSHLVSPIRRELSKNMDDHLILQKNLVPSVKHVENSSKPVSDLVKTDFVVSDPDIGSRSVLLTASIEEGSHVEVIKDRGVLKKAWFSATVLSLKDGEVLVSYKGLRSDDGSKQLEEWIPIEAKDGDPPNVRIPHPLTAMQFEGTRKRRRAAVTDYNWFVGDRVDAWVEDCWCEGIIAEKNKKDATTLSVHFPAQGETLKIKAWNLRPSLIWKDGQWIEWCRPRHDGTYQGETPIEKRPKLGSTSIEAKGKPNITKNINFAEIERNLDARLPLSANEKVFNIGYTRQENKPNMVRTTRTGLEREGSRVVFGVPRPGKKRKFMEVSKHYVSDRTAKTNVPNDSAKLAKFLMPQGSGSRGIRNSSKLDPKGNKVAYSKPRALKSQKPLSIPSRTLSRKDDSISLRPNARNAAVSDRSAKASISNDENESSEQNLTDVEEASGRTMVFSSQALPQENRKKAARNTKSERLNQGKFAPAGGKSAKDEAAEKLVSEAAEPRRSNRRIQPTSRLLEGLQSSLIISKIPSSSHEKGHRSVSRGTARGSNNRG